MDEGGMRESAYGFIDYLLVLVFLSAIPVFQSKCYRTRINVRFGRYRRVTRSSFRSCVAINLTMFDLI